MARILVTALLCVFALLPGTVTAAGLKDTVKALELGYSTLDDVQADFSQRTTVAGFKQEQKGNGVVYIRRVSGAPAMFRFNYAKPPQQLISNGKTVWFYQPENKQVIVSDLAAALQGGGGATLNYLADLGQVSRDFEIKFVGDGRDKKQDYVLELIPRKKSPVMAKLQLTIAAKAVEDVAAGGKGQPFPVVASRVFDHAGGSTYLEFTKVKVNKGLSPSLFTFKAPKGVEVIKNQ